MAELRERLKNFQLFPKQFGYFPLLFLLYLLFPIYYVGQTAGFKLVLGYLMILLFIVSYRQLYFKKAFIFWLSIQFAIILILSIAYSPYHILMGFFPAHFISWFHDRVKFRIFFAVLFVVIIAPILAHLDTFVLADSLMLLIFSAVMLMSPFATRSMYERMELEKELDVANEKIKELVKREERMRIARDLHDTLGHTLSLITLKSQLVGKLVTKNPEKAKLEAKEIESTSRTALKQIRELVADMRSITLAEELVQVETILKAAGISFQYNGDIALKEISQLTQNILSMCLREAITNVVKHSKASSCLIEVIKTEGEVRLTVQDNGVGALEMNQQGSGLKGIKERLSLIDGTLVLKADHGTKLTMTVPVIIKQSKEETL